MTEGISKEHKGRDVAIAIADRVRAGKLADVAAQLDALTLQNSRAVNEEQRVALESLAQQVVVLEALFSRLVIDSNNLPVRHIGSAAHERLLNMALRTQGAVVRTYAAILSVGNQARTIPAALAAGAEAEPQTSGDALNGSGERGS